MDSFGMDTGWTALHNIRDIPLRHVVHGLDMRPRLPWHFTSSRAPGLDKGIS
jgi:hypothetical protein